ncbi:unnamed protein product [Caenorhabditis auriculariae]|uniref:BTB domain-containing protein n=1 Tax=Caenorhabditis auriculariae TaxID=2777116 RepID=A0A8S1GUT3_9PELO|nr:unnamed protein product [Caenorhabditis auriculariae]
MTSSVMLNRPTSLITLPVNVLLSLPTREHECFLNDYSDKVNFEASTYCRNFPLYVRGKLFYVDKAIFSANSEFFKAMMDSDRFLEGALGRIEINDESPEDILTLIRAISPNYLGLYPDAVDESNVCSLLRLCDKYLFLNLKENCLDYLQNYEASERSTKLIFRLFCQICSMKWDVCNFEELEIVSKAVRNCLDELLRYRSVERLAEIRQKLHDERKIKICEAILKGNVLFSHRLSFREEVQGLTCQCCSRIRSFKSVKRLIFCNSCLKEVCNECRRTPCWTLIDECYRALSTFYGYSNHRHHLSLLLQLLLIFLHINCEMSSNGYGDSGPVRSASHAGSWYSGNQRELDRQLSKWLDQAGESVGVARAVISPHAGYSYCGETAAYAFKQIVPDTINRIFVLGPSHVVSLSGCALTTCSLYRTPLADLHIDQTVNDELKATRQFDSMDRRDEETEHSIEMQLPFIAKVMGSRRFTIVPVLVGSLPGSKQLSYGKIFANYLEDPRNLFVISSDFCHWGDRFSFSPFDRNSGVPIFEQISSLDHAGMKAIESLNPSVFNEYLKKTQNTICGRNPILVMLQAADQYRKMNNHTHEFRFLNYSQSNKVRSASDSSVSYAAGALFLHPK